MDNEKGKILIVDDAKLNITILTNILTPKYDVTAVVNGKSAIAKAVELKPDLILLDIILPDINGFDIIKIFKDSDDLRDIPIICITGLSDYQDEIKGLKLGAIDYIKKPFVDEIVRARVDNQIILGHQRKLVEEIAQYDFLTQIPNRRNFDKELARAWEGAKRDKTVVHIGYFDIDYFKQYNDNYGHSKGDEALRKVAHTASDALKQCGGYISRVGGEEFCFILYGCEKDEAEKKADLLRQTIQNIFIEHKYSECNDVLTVSVGGASMTVTEAADKMRTLQMVDENLYLAKKRGRNCVVWYKENC